MFEAAQTSAVVARNFFGQTMAYFALAVGAATTAVFAGILLLPPTLVFSTGFLLLTGLFSLALVWTSRSWSQASYGFALLILLAGLLGFSLVPLVALAVTTAGVPLLGKALLSATGLYLGLALYGYTTERDLSGLGGFLTASLIGMIVVSLLTLVLHLFGIEVWNSTIELYFAGFGVLVFAGFTAYDFQKVKLLAHEITPIQAAITLFLNFILLFQYVLRFMLALTNRR